MSKPCISYADKATVKTSATIAEVEDRALARLIPAADR
jgi:hypothetical protein